MNPPREDIASPIARHNEAAAIVDGLTLEEKASLCSGRNFWFTEAIEHAGVPSVMMTDGPHGLRKQGGSGDHLGLGESVPATCFPTASALASSWDTALLEEIGSALGLRSAAEQVALVLGPGLNIKRHPLCGRNFEYFSEDPLLSGRLAAAMVRGIQSQGVGACIKHFAVNNQEQARMVTDAVVDPRTLHEIYLRGFEIAVREAQPWAVMCAYNRLNGTYCGEHDWLLNRILRDAWGFDGLVVTDWGAMDDRVAGIAAGLDLEMPGSAGQNDARVVAAVQDGSLDETLLDQAVRRNLAFALAGDARLQQGATSNADEEHGLARRAAAESAVLLTNNTLLPLARNSRLAVIGEFARHPRYQGAGSSRVNPTRLDSAYDAITDVLGEAPPYAAGYDRKAGMQDDTLDEDRLAAAVALAETAEVVVVFAGLPSQFESEGFDRTHMRLPQQHDELIRRVCAANPHTVVVLTNGAPVEMPWAEQPGAILECYLAGQAGGGAVADLLFGSANPCGKLAETFPLRQSDFPSDTNFPGSARQVQYREGPFIGYRFFDTARAPVRFAFGHGLSYTSFSYSDLHLSAPRLAGGAIVRLSVTVTNTGSMAGKEVVQLYIHALASPVTRPEQELCAFTKVALDPGASTRVTFRLGIANFQHFDVEAGGWRTASGDYALRVGSGSRDLRGQALLKVQAEDDLAGDAWNLPTGSGDAMLPPDAFVASDTVFAELLGRPLPVEAPARPFHRNSTLGEVRASLLGALLYSRLAQAFGGRRRPDTPASQQRMLDAMREQMPLRALVLFSRGRFTFEGLDVLLHLLNWRPVKAWRAWRASRRSAAEA